MSHASSAIARLKLIGGDLALDFINTAGWRGAPGSRDLLADYDDLIAWSERAAALPSEQSLRLRHLAADDPARASSVHQEAMRFREALYRVFVSLATGSAGQSSDLEAVNGVVAEARRHLRLARDNDRLSWVWRDVDRALEWPLWIVARSASDLLTSERLPRVRQCEGDRCDWLFLDGSKNRSRRWCDMADCGNRAKARRNYAKRRASSADPGS